jgi:hypothetical protein
MIVAVLTPLTLHHRFITNTNRPFNVISQRNASIDASLIEWDLTIHTSNSTVSFALEHNTTINTVPSRL